MVEVKAKPHGNSRSSKPFFRTAQTAKAHHKEIAKKNTPKSALHIASQEQGGELNIKALNKEPRIYNSLKIIGGVVRPKIPMFSTELCFNVKYVREKKNALLEM